MVTLPAGDAAKAGQCRGCPYLLRCNCGGDGNINILKEKGCKTRLATYIMGIMQYFNALSLIRVRAFAASVKAGNLCVVALASFSLSL
jgi:hypothetical protein